MTGKNESNSGGTLPFIRTWLQENKNVTADALNVEETFVTLGMDSIEAMTLVGDLEDELGRRLSPTLAWDYPTPRAMADHLDAEGVDAPAAQGPAAGSSDSDLLERIDELSEEEVDRLLAARMQAQLSQDS